MKVVTRIVRRPELSPAAFRDYYETRHAPLGTRYFPFEKYVRNFVVSSRPDAGFDCLMECWLDRQKALASLDGEIDRIFREDEARFMVERGIGNDVHEAILFGPPRGIEEPGTHKLVWLLARRPGQSFAALREAAQVWAASTAGAAGLVRVELDEVVARPGEPAFPGDAILTAWLAAGARRDDQLTLPQALEARTALVCEPAETPPEALRDAFGKRDIA